MFETFDSVSKKDITGGSIDGVISPYSIPAKDSIGIALDAINSDEDRLDNKISAVYKKCQYNIMIASSSNVDGFRTLCDRLLEAFKLNKVFDNDPMIQNKLAEILAYAYTSKTSKYLIYADINKAKTIAQAVFTSAKKPPIGLSFLNPKVEDLLKKILLTIFYKIDFSDKNKK